VTFAVGDRVSWMDHIGEIVGIDRDHAYVQCGAARWYLPIAQLERAP